MGRGGAAVLIGALERGSDRAIAIVRSNGEALTYAALRARVANGARDLEARGARRGRAVGVSVADPCNFVVATLAAWRTGAAVVPIDPRAGDAWIASAAARARVVVAVTDVATDGTLDIAAGEGAPIDERAALVLFTSGSSAEPKLVLLSADGIDANVRAIVDYLPIAEHPRTAVVVPLSYSYGLVGQVLTTLHVGATLVLLGDVVFPPLQVEAMTALDARGLSTVPASLRLLARAVAAPSSAPSLGYVASAGGPLDLATIAMARAAFPHARLFNQYGLTEASPRVTALDEREPAFALGSVGRPLRGIDVWAVAPDGTRAPAGTEGELVVRGPSVMLGYLGDLEGTARVLSADGALRTGDSGHVDVNGYVFVSGRNDGVVKCAGERVSVEEIAALLRTADGVRDAYVIAVPHPELGATLHAFVEANADVVPQLRRMVRSLPPAKRPSRFVAMDALPRTPNGKVARAALPIETRPPRPEPR